MLANKTMSLWARRTGQAIGFLLPILAGAAVGMLFVLFVLGNLTAWIALTLFGSLAAIVLLFCYITGTPRNAGRRGR